MASRVSNRKSDHRRAGEDKIPWADGRRGDGAGRGNLIIDGMMLVTSENVDKVSGKRCRV